MNTGTSLIDCVIKSMTIHAIEGRKIMNAKRLTIKKRMSDCCVQGCRLVLILDDLLWVLTDDQLKASSVGSVPETKEL